MASKTINNKFLINAPAGSGKTTSIKNYLKSLYMNRPESRILCITYTNRAADELKKDLESPNITVSTIHSYINKLIKPFFAQAEAIELYWEIYGQKIIDRINNADCDEKIAESNQRYREKHGGLSLDIIKKNVVELSYGETPFTSLYSGRFSHDDLLMFTYELAKKYPVILRKISHKYNYIFVDEYQDTSAYILKLFYEAVKFKPDVVLYLLGDRMQQIYRNYDGSFEENFKEFDTSRKLDINYRSIGEVVSILNKIYNESSFNQTPTERNKGAKPDISPRILFTSNVEETIKGIQTEFPDILVLYLMNKEKFKEIGAQGLYEGYSNMEMYSVEKKYSPTDVLSDLSDDNPDPVMRLLFFVHKVIRLYCDGNYGTAISLCKKQKKCLDISRFRVQSHADKKTIKNMFDEIRKVYNDDECSIRQLFDCLQALRFVRGDVLSRIYDSDEYRAIFDVKLSEIRNLATYVGHPNISTQHGVKGESHTSVAFVAKDSINLNVRMYLFLKIWAYVDFSLPEFEELFYSYKRIIAEVEREIGMKTSKLSQETYKQNEAARDVLKKYSKQLLDEYSDNRIFEVICKKDFVTYLDKPNVGNAKKIFNISVMEGVLTAYKLFYVGCSRARKNLIVVVDEKKVSEFKDAFMARAKVTGFDCEDWDDCVHEEAGILGDKR